MAFALKSQKMKVFREGSRIAEMESRTGRAFRQELAREYKSFHTGRKTIWSSIWSSRSYTLMIMMRAHQKRIAHALLKVFPKREKRIRLESKDSAEKKGSLENTSSRGSSRGYQAETGSPG